VVADIAKLSVGREEYYTRELATDHQQYLSGHGESPGRWYGAGATSLGGTVASGPKVRLAGSRVEPLPVQTAARSAQSNQSWHRRWRLGTLVEDAGLSGRQMQQCHRRPIGARQGPQGHRPGQWLGPASLWWATMWEASAWHE
jgi:hypothetical protein